MSKANSNLLCRLMLCVVSVHLSFPVWAQRNDWQLQQQQRQQEMRRQQDMQRQQAQEQQRRQAQEQQRQQLREQQRRLMQEQQRQVLQEQQRERMRGQQRRALQDQQQQKLQNQQRQRVLNQQAQSQKQAQAQSQQRQRQQASDRQRLQHQKDGQSSTLKSTFNAAANRPPTPGEIERGFTGMTTKDGKALIRFQGRLIAVPIAQVSSLSAVFRNSQQLHMSQKLNQRINNVVSSSGVENKNKTRPIRNSGAMDSYTR